MSEVLDAAPHKLAEAERVLQTAEAEARALNSRSFGYERETRELAEQIKNGADLTPEEMGALIVRRQALEALLAALARAESASRERVSMAQSQCAILRNDAAALQRQLPELRARIASAEGELSYAERCAAETNASEAWPGRVVSARGGLEAACRAVERAEEEYRAITGEAAP